MADGSAGDEEAPPSYHSLFGQSPCSGVVVVQQPLLSVRPVVEDRVRSPANDGCPEQEPLSYVPDVHVPLDVTSIGPPPPYHRARTDSPPSYDTLFGRVIAAHNQSTTRIEFLRRFYDLLRETLGCTLFLGIIMAVPVTMIIMGCMHLFDCPAEDYIPLYLLVGGIAVTAKILKSLLEMYTCKDCPQIQHNFRGNDALEVVLIFFIIGWFIAGNMWIYRTHGHFDSKNPNASNYCSPYVFYFAFWLTTSVYILFAVFLCCMYGLSALGSKSAT